MSRSQDETPLSTMFQEEYDRAPRVRNDSIASSVGSSHRSFKRRQSFKPDPFFKIVTLDATLKNFDLAKIEAR